MQLINKQLINKDIYTVGWSDFHFYFVFRKWAHCYQLSLYFYELISKKSEERRAKAQKSKFPTLIELIWSWLELDWLCMIGASLIELDWSFIGYAWFELDWLCLIGSSLIELGASLIMLDWSDGAWLYLHLLSLIWVFFLLICLTLSINDRWSVPKLCNFDFVSIISVR